MGVGDTRVAVGAGADEVRGWVVEATGPALVSDGELTAAGDASDQRVRGISMASVSMANPYPAPTAASNRTTIMEILTKRI